MVLEGVDAFGGEDDAAFGGAGLGVQDSQAPGGGALEGAVDAGRAAVEIEVFSVQPEEFTLTEARAQGELVKSVHPVAAGGVEELTGLARREGLEAPRAGCWGLDVAARLICRCSTGQPGRCTGRTSR